jgi:heme A synthase
MIRMIIAFLLAPFPAAIFQSAIVSVWPKPGQGVFENPSSMFVAILLFFYAFQLILGLPIFLLIRKRLSPTLRTFGLIGMMVVLIPILVGIATVAYQGGISAYALIYNVTFFALGGFAAGAVFWSVAFASRNNGGH